MSARTETRRGFLKKATSGAGPMGSGVLVFSDDPAAAEARVKTALPVDRRSVHWSRIITR